MFAIRYERAAVDDLKAIRAHDRGRIMDAISRELRDRPLDEGGRKKYLPAFSLWPQLRVGDYRVFYDVEDSTVVVRMVRLKGQKTTKEIL